MERQDVSQLGLQIHHEHQLRDELLACRGDQFVGAHPAPLLAHPRHQRDRPCHRPHHVWRRRMGAAPQHRHLACDGGDRQSPIGTLAHRCRMDVPAPVGALALHWRQAIPKRRLPHHGGSRPLPQPDHGKASRERLLAGVPQSLAREPASLPVDHCRWRDHGQRTHPRPLQSCARGLRPAAATHDVERQSARQAQRTSPTANRPLGTVAGMARRLGQPR